MLSIWDDDLAVRSHHNGRTSEPKMSVMGFDAPDEPAEVWARSDYWNSRTA